MSSPISTTSRTLGIDVVWLCPVYRSPQEDNGYDISDYQSVDPLFGTLADLDTVIRAVHDRGMRLIMDLVVNHTSDQHPWFVESRRSRDTAKADWYFWRDARPGTVPGQPGSEPNNWGAAFSGSAWEWVPERGQYYLHLFAVGQPDLNWDNPEVRDAVFTMMSWWLDRGVDGFRMDVINFISKDPALPDGPVTRTGYGDGMPYFSYGPQIHAYLAEMRRRVFDPRPGSYLTVGEMPGVTPQQARSVHRSREHGQLTMVFQFEHVVLDQDGDKWTPRAVTVSDLRDTLGPMAAGAGRRRLEQPVLEQPRPAAGRVPLRERHGTTGTSPPPRSRPAAPAPGNALRLPGRRARDDERPVRHHRGLPRPRVARLLRDRGRHARPGSGAGRSRPCGARAGTTHAPRCSGTARLVPVSATAPPWIPVNPNHTWLNAASQTADPGSIYSYYRALIALRHDRPAIVDGEFAVMETGREQIYAFRRSLGDEHLEVYVNLSDHP